MKPIALTMGDPSGIGPEIVVKLLADRPGGPPLVVFGDVAILTAMAVELGIELVVRAVRSVSEAYGDPAVLSVIQGPSLPANLPRAVVSAPAGAAAFAYVEAAISAAMAEEVAAIVTAPINKEAMRLAGVPYAGHTEILAALSGSDDYSMMLASDDLRVVLVTIHEPLRSAIDLITRDSVLRTIKLIDHSLRSIGKSPRIAVAGLNPHAGENGLMGREEIDIIAPAVEAARKLGIEAEGPFPPDTVFMRARGGEFDVVVAQHHDQGLIPFKYLGIDKGVNVTLGLPFVRTSVDHGTAFDMVGKGVADHSSLRIALEQAIALVRTPH